MSDVLSRAAQLGRAVQPVEPEVAVDLRQEEVATVEIGTVAEPSGAAPTPSDVKTQESDGSSPAGTEAGTPDGSILVPLDAWERMLGQLGNLHEAGQQLADARERAAKAETEVEFLRERMRELRKRAEEAELAADLTQQPGELRVGPVVSGKPFQARWRHWLDSWLR